MQIVSGVSWEQPDKTWRKFSVSLGPEDLERLVREGKTALDADADVADLPIADRFRTLQKAADRLLIYQMAKEGAISGEEAQRQIAAL